MTKKGLTHCTLILDRSGSMMSIRTDVIGGVNQFIKTQREQPGECTFTLVQFDSKDPYEVLCDHVPIKEAKDLGDEYVPRDWTPLFDAIGRGITNTGSWLASLPEHERPEKVVFVTMTDGAENASKEFDAASVSKLTKEQTEKYGWQFVYLGADHDAMKAGASLGIVAANVSPYSKSNFAGAIRTSAQKLAAYRSGTVTDMALDADDRAAMQ